MPTTLTLSEVVNIVLVLFAVFQLWDASKTKRDLRYGLTAVREMVEQEADPRAILSALDGNVAILGGRMPFVEHAKRVSDGILARFKKVDAQTLPTPSPMSAKEVLGTGKNSRPS